MLGAIIGDIVGSVYEFGSDKTKNFPLFTPGSSPTDDSLMTIAVGCACVSADTRDEDDFKRMLRRLMREIGRLYPDAGYGESFYRWLMSDSMGAYNSYGNGSAMRVSPVAYAAETLGDVERLARWSAEVTHNHPSGVRGAQAVAAAVFLARTGADKTEIKRYIEEKYYDLGFTLDEIRPSYRFDVTCDGSVPQAIVCFLEADSFEDAVRNAVSLGGDGDTIAAMAGGIAEAYFGIPAELEERALGLLDDTLTEYYFEYADSLYD